MARSRRSRIDLRREVEAEEREEVDESEEIKPPMPRPIPPFAASNPALAEWFTRIWDAVPHTVRSLCTELKAAQLATDDELKAAIRTFPTTGPLDEFRTGQVLWELFQDASVLDNVIRRYATEDTEDELTEMLDWYANIKGGCERLLVEIAVECPDFVREFVEQDRTHLIAGLLVADEAGHQLIVDMMQHDESSRVFDDALPIVFGHTAKLDEASPLVEYLREVRTNPRGWVLAGCVLWRVTERVDRRWLKRFIKWDEDRLGWSDERDLVVQVLAEALSVQPLASEALVQLTRRGEDGFDELSMTAVAEIGQRGLRGWSTLVRMAPVARSETRQRILEFAARDSRTAQAFLPLARVILHNRLAEKLSEEPYFEEEAQDELAYVFRLIQAAGPAGRALAPDLLQLLKALPLIDDAPFLLIERCLETLQYCGANDPMTLAGLRAILDTGMTDGDDLSRPFKLVVHTFLVLNPGAVLQEMTHPCGKGRLFDHLQSNYPLVRLPDSVRRSMAARIADLLLHPDPAVGPRAIALLAEQTAHAPRIVPQLVAACCSMNEPFIAGVSKIVLDGDARSRVVATLSSRMEGTNPDMALRAAVGLWFLNQHRPIFEMLMRELSQSNTGLPMAFLEWHQKRGQQLTAICATLRQSLGDWIGLDPDRSRFLHSLSQRLIEPQLAEVWKQLQSPEADRTATIARACELLPYGDDLLVCLARLILSSVVGPDDRSKFGTLLPVKYFIRRDNLDIPTGKAKRDAVYEVLMQPASVERSRALTAAVFGESAAIHADVHGLLGHPVSWLRWVGLTLLEGYPLAADELRGRVEPFLKDPSEMVREKAMEVCVRIG